jgi:hypothetical protein
MGRLDRFANPVATQGAGVAVVCPRCGGELRLLLHYDAKTAPGAVITKDSRGRVQARATIPNAFYLPAGPLDMGGSCPGHTAACVNCYAAGLESWAPGFRRSASANLATLEHLYRCGGSRAVVRALVAIVERSADLQRVAGVVRPAFRWHSDGDIFSAWYARAIRRAVLATPGVDHWLYTRSLGLVCHLLPAPENLAVYISADSFNVVRAAKVAGRYGLPVAMLADDRAHAVALWARARAVAPGLPSPVLCPAVGKWADDAATSGTGVPAHVVGPDGRRSTAVPGGAAVGACIACQVCLPGGSNRSVTFTVHGGRARPGSPGRLGAAVAVRLRDRDRVTL